MGRECESVGVSVCEGRKNTQRQRRERVRGKNNKAKLYPKSTVCPGKS